MKLRVKIQFFLASLLLLLGIALVVFVKITLTDNLLTELKTHGTAVAKNLAQISVNDILTEQYLNLKLLVSDFKNNNGDIAYIFIQDSHQKIIASTFNNVFPSQLQNINQLAPGQKYNIKLIVNQNTPIYDIVVPVLEGQAGYLHVAFDKTSLVRSVNNILRLIVYILLAALLLSGTLAYLFTTLTTKPLLELADTARHVAKGQFDRLAQVTTTDEIGDLGRVFNQMIGELHLLHEELEEQCEELKALDKMKDSLISDVTHELKTPVAKHKMQVELLRHFLAKQNLTSEGMPIIRKMEASLARQEQVIENILTLARLEGGNRKFQREPLLLNELIAIVLQDFETKIKEHDIEVEAKLPAVSLNSDKEMLYHLFSNLVDNAIKYRSLDREGKIAISLSAAEKQIQVKFADNGIGMAAAEQHRAFERFYQASASAEGCGIGLSISSIIVRELGGTIRLESEGKDKGTTVIVELPAECPPPHQERGTT